MAHESIILELRSSSDWDGVTATALSRDNATVIGKRYFKFDLSGAHGYLEADLGGLFSPVSAKLVGIAYSSWNPISRARVSVRAGVAGRSCIFQSGSDPMRAAERSAFGGSCQDPPRTTRG